MAAARRNDPVVIGKILAALRVGNTIETAAHMGGVQGGTLREWMRQDAALADAVVQAIAEREFNDVAALDAFTQRNDKLGLDAIKFRLERLNPAVWGRASRNDEFTRQEQIRRGM